LAGEGCAKPYFSYKKPVGKNYEKEKNIYEKKKHLE
jgi:hypothetical protein